jgi:beta-glucosidase
VRDLSTLPPEPQPNESLRPGGAETLPTGPGSCKHSDLSMAGGESMRHSKESFGFACMAAVSMSVVVTLAVTSAGAADVDALLQGMTLEQKVSFLYGASDPESLGEAGYVPGVPGLGIPPLRLADGPAGVRVRATATAMPAPVALASSFDPSLARRFGEVIGREGRALRQDVLLAPMVNLVRVPQAGRNFETLGEDPLLASRLAEEEFRGIQGAGLIATIKHFVLNNQEHERRNVNVNVDEQTLHEIYLPGFEGAIRGGAGAVMCSYNRVGGAWACDSREVLTEMLRDQLGFAGWVMTDWGATHTLDALEAGLDQEMPGRGRRQVFASDLLDAAKKGAVPLSAVDRAVRRILVQMDRVGLLDETPPPRPPLDVEADAAVARDVALAGAVLLKNEKEALPLGGEDLGSVVLIGPTAKTLLVGGGGSSHVLGFADREKSPLEALVEQAGPGARITHVDGIDLEGVVVPASALALTVRHGDAGEIDFTGSDALPSTTQTDAYRWAGTLTVPSDGEYELMVQHSGGRGSLSLDGEEVLSVRGFFGGSLIQTADGLRRSSVRLDLTAGTHAFELVVGAGGFGPPPYRPTGPIGLRLAWVTPEHRQASIDEAVEAARAARVAVVFAYNEGTEGRDRTSLALPGDQDALIDAVASAREGRTIVVLNTGDPVLMPWLEKTDAVLQMWYPGQEGGGATAALLLGRASPGGKLPETFPRAETDLPTTKPEQYPGVETANGLEQWYSEGIFVGYRWYDQQAVEPLFPFGHGLSYTRFEYSDLSVRPAGDGFDVSFEVRNAGRSKGAEVPQVYLGPPSGGLPKGHAVAPQTLAGFARIELAPGEARRVSVHVGARELSYWSKDDRAWVVATGSRPISVGASSRDIRLRGTADRTGGGAQR